MIVADTNLVAYLLIEGERTEAARQVWRRDPDWVLPPLWRSEFLNVLATSVRARVLNEAQAFEAFANALELFGRREMEPGGEAVLRCALERRVSAYDAQFIVLAERLGVKMVTADRRLEQACRPVCVTLERFVARR